MSETITSEIIGLPKGGLIEPTHTNPDLWVENVYPQPTGEEDETVEPDVASHVEFTEYAEDRLRPRDPGSPPEIIPYKALIPGTRRVKAEGYVGNWTPKKAAALFVATFAVANMVANAASAFADVHEAAAPLFHRAKVTVSSWLGHKDKPHTHLESQTHPGTLQTVEGGITLQPLGHSAPNAGDISNVLQWVKDTEHAGNTVRGIAIVGNASDETTPTAASLGRHNASNDQLALKRAMDEKHALEAADAADPTVTLPPITVVGNETVLSDQTIDHLKDVASRHHMTLDQALRAYDGSGATLPAELRTELDKTLGANRYSKPVYTVQAPDTITTVTVEDKIPPYHHDNKNHDYMLLPGVPIPWRRRREDIADPRIETRYWQRPAIEPDQRWVELYKEALLEDGTLDPNAIFLSRKMQLLAREGRFKAVLTHTFTDPEGAEREARAIFVNHEPTPETVEMFKELLTAASESRDGAIADTLKNVFVFPTENAGLGHDDPKRIGLGVDKQDPRDVLGWAAPALGAVEIHMPTDPTKAELYDYDKILFTAIHELIGHGASTKEQPIRLTQVGPATVRHYASENPWDEKLAADEFERFPDVDAPGRKEFMTTRRIVTADGEVVTRHEHMQEGDPRLADTSHATLLGRKPNKYAGASRQELFAEVAGFVVSHSLAPYGTAGVVVDQYHPKLGTGYTVDPQLKQMVEERLGWSRTRAAQIDDSQFALAHPLEDPFLRGIIDKARRTPMAEDRITILANISRG